VPPDTKREILYLFGAMLDRRIEKHGSGAFSNAHEGLGVIAEEYHELLEAVRTNDQEQVAREAIDVAVAAIWTVVSLATHNPDLAKRLGV